MDDYTKRMFLALGLSVLFLMAWLQYVKMTAPQLQQTTQPTTQPTTQVAATRPAANDSAAASRPAAPTDGESNAAASARYAATSAGVEDVVSIGSDTPDAGNPYRLKLEIDPRGASVRTVTLADHRKTVRRRKSDPPPPAYELLKPVQLGDEAYRSFVARSLRFPDQNDAEVKLSDIVWNVERLDEPDAEGVRLWTRISEDGIDILELSRFVRIHKKRRQFNMDWRIDNLSDRPIRLLLTDTGPTGIEPADERFDHPRVMVTKISQEGTVAVGDHDMREKVIKAEDHRLDFKTGEDSIYWSALSNKYFTCLVFPRPLESKSSHAGYLDRVSGIVRAPNQDVPADLSIEQVLAPKPIAAGQSLTMSFDVYCGDKNETSLAAVPTAAERQYALVGAPDRSSCTFESIGRLLAWLLARVYRVVGNYGVAIILLVIVVRVCLHPITKKAQVNMMRMQKNTQRLKPKMDALQQQYKNDRQKLGEETMKLYREEGISPTGTLSGCIPMFLQTPIWIALYTMLNTDVLLRHQPFFAWINDLSAPDHLIQFSSSFQIPFLYRMMGPISALNVLPIIMAFVMWAQMKLSQKMAKAKEAEKSKSDDPNAPSDMMATQQKMMGFLMPLFGLMFYNMPSGLCLYILSNSVLGMGELYFIRKQLREEEEQGVFEKLHKKKKKKSWFATTFENLQKRAELAKQGQLTSQQSKAKKRKKPRF